MVRMITEDEMEQSRQEKTSEQLKLKKQITDIVENLKEKLNRAIQELKTVKDENTRLKGELEAVNRTLEQEIKEGPAPGVKTSDEAADPGILETFKTEIENLKNVILERDKKIELDKDVLERTTTYKEELEKRISDLTGELHQMGASMTKDDQETPTTPIFAPVEVAKPEPIQPRGGKLLGAKKNGGGSILGSRQAEPTPGTVPEPAVPEPVQEKEAVEAAPVLAEPAETTAPIPIMDQTEEPAICPVCGGEGVIGVRKKDSSIVQEVCPNCRGAGKV